MRVEVEKSSGEESESGSKQWRKWEWKLRIVLVKKMRVEVNNEESGSVS